MPRERSPAPIGVFDSGVGGLSVLRAIRQELPGQPIIYLADQAHVPYGARPLEEVRQFSEAITRFLLGQGAHLVVVACNTASAAALQVLRKTFPETRFVGMEPAVKPAAETTQSGVVGVLATPATFQSELYASVIERFAHGVQILQDTCPGLVCQIEAGNLAGRETRRILEAAVLPMLDAGVDGIVLGCTHYPFVIPLIEQIVADYFQEKPPAEARNVRVIDPAPAVARQVRRLLEIADQSSIRADQSSIRADQSSIRADQSSIRASPPGAGQEGAQIRYLTSGNSQDLQDLLPRLIGEGARVSGLSWQGADHLVEFQG